MTYNPHATLQREIDSLRKQLIRERETSRLDDSMIIDTTVKKAEERTLERCIVECMEEANTPTYTEEERIAILTAVKRLKEMRPEYRRMREEQERIEAKKQQEYAYTHALAQSMKQTGEAYKTAINQVGVSGSSVTNVWWDEVGVTK